MRNEMYLKYLLKTKKKLQEMKSRRAHTHV
jgi:hypothetical protein